jgi:CRP/FNR family transcriptional regulator, anaerobic regulatory protein
MRRATACNGGRQRALCRGCFFDDLHRRCKKSKCQENAKRLKAMARAGFPDLFGKGALNSRELRKLQRLATPVRFRSGQQIVAEGETASEVYGLSQGVVRVYKKLADGRHHVLRFALPGDFLELPRGECHGLSAEAIGAVSASRFARCELFEFIQASRTTARLMIDFAALELKRSQDQMVLLGRGIPEEQLTAFLANWRKRLPRRPDRFVSLPMSRRDIAAHLGMAPETLTRTFAKLARKKIIGVAEDGVELLDIEPNRRPAKK